MLLDHQRMRPRLDQVRERLRSELAIDVTSHDPLVEEVLAFGEAARIFLEAACAEWSAGGKHGERRVLAHFHEWLGGLALPMLRGTERRLSSVFTTHATQVGRYSASGEPDFYERLADIDPDPEAVRYGIAAQHRIERACVERCDLLTTVSPITAEECTALLGRTPDVLTPNGLNIDFYDLGADFQTAHAQHKEEIHQFVMSHFFPSYSFDLDRTLYFFTSGRFEPRNKGFDLCLESMARLNLELLAAKLDVTVVFFIVTNRSTQSLDPRVLYARGVLDELRDVSGHISEDLAARLFRRGAMGDRVRLDDLVDEYWLLRFRRTQHALRSHALPPLTTHVIDHDFEDPVLQQIRSLRIGNTEGEPVKVVYHPDFISPVNPLWGIEYDHFVRGCHLGIFPSSYEPWGYTPLECLALGVPAITSDLAGFGRYVSETHPDHERWGLHVVPRRGHSFEAAAADLTQRLLAFCRLDRPQRIGLRNELQPHCWEFHWPKLGTAYHEAHDRVLAAAS